MNQHNKAFTIPARCSIQSVNAALHAAGFETIDIFRDPCADHRISISHRMADEFGHPYYMDQRTSAETPREWAERFAQGEWHD